MADVQLRIAERSDLRLLSSLLNDAGLQAQVMGPAKTRSMAEVEDWLDQKLDNPDTRFRMVDQGGRAIGYVQLVNIDWASGVGTVGICLDGQSRGSGLGTGAMERLHEFARGELGLRKLILSVRADNAAAVRLYQKLGYVTAGKLTDHFSTGSGYVDVLLMEYWLARAAA